MLLVCMVYLTLAMITLRGMSSSLASIKKLYLSFCFGHTTWSRNHA